MCGYVPVGINPCGPVAPVALVEGTSAPRQDELPEVIAGLTKIVDLAVEQGAGHDEALDLVGALVDLGDLSPSRGRPGDLPGEQSVSSGNMSR